MKEHRGSGGSHLAHAKVSDVCVWNRRDLKYAYFDDMQIGVFLMGDSVAVPVRSSYLLEECGSTLATMRRGHA